MNSALHVHTIGHSNHTTKAFVALLHQHGITTIVDVRSQPYSQWTPQFNREVFAKDLKQAGITYRYMGDTLGGRPKDPAMYDAGQERPNYKRMEQTTRYQRGIANLLYLAAETPVAIMCSEGDHRQCHRNLLITETLLNHGAQVLHIQTDGTIVPGQAIAEQLSLF